MTRGVHLDPVTVEVLWQRLVTIVEECEAVIKFTSFSSTVGEAADFSAVLLDADAQMLAQSPVGSPGFLGILNRAARVLLQRFPKEHLSPGDVIITNDPWIGAGHLPDVLLLCPLFFEGRLVAFSVNIAHLSDIGGRVSAEATDLFQEGLQIPPTYLFRAGEPNEDVFSFIQQNSRTPRLVVGDLNAQMAAHQTAQRRVEELLLEYGMADLQDLSDEVQRRTEQAMLEAIARLPSGDYHGEAWSDGIDEPLRLSVKVTVHQDSITVDYAGTAPQVDRGINCPFNLTYAESVHAIRTMLTPRLPSAEGALRPLHVMAPEGSIVNPRYPAPVMIRVAVIHNAHAAIFRALAPLVPEYIKPSAISAHSGGIWAFRFRGKMTNVPSLYKKGGPPQVEPNFVQMYLFNGGVGATGTADGRPSTSIPANVGNVPVEVMEARAPIMFLSKELCQDTGGPGTYRGGVGQQVRIQVTGEDAMEFVPGACDRIKNPPFGLHGGEPGSGGTITVDDQPVHIRKAHEVHAGQVVCVRVPGGGGYGPVGERSRERVSADVEMGYVSKRAAQQRYGFNGRKTGDKEAKKA